jgi:hypothetical protein
MVAVPAVKPVTTPVVGLITATAGLLDDHVPPVDVVAKLTVEPVQTVCVPVSGAIKAVACTVIVLDTGPVDVQPDAFK